MSVIKEYLGRVFSENFYFQPNERQLAKISSGNGWINTVESGLHQNRQSKEFDKTIIRIVRWRARKNKQNKQKEWWVKSKYNVLSSEEWENTKAIINSLMKGNLQSPSFIQVPHKEIDRLYAAENERLAFKQKLSEMRSNIRGLKSTLREYNNMILDTDTTETDIHKFLVKHKAFWMFGLEYNGIKSKVSFPPSKNYYEFDLMLRRYDDFWDLVELKGPNENLFNKRTRKRSVPNQNLSHAVGQVFTYLYAVDMAGELDIVKPKAYVVIGKEGTDNASERRVFSSYLTNIELITHSELYKRGERLLKYIQNNNPEK
jgi:hypothetical protein